VPGKSLIRLVAILCLTPTLLASGVPAKESVRVYPAPVGEPMSKRFTVSVKGQSAPVYVAHVKAIGTVGTATVKEEQVDGEASFALFDLKGEATVTVTCAEKVKAVKVLPTSRGIVAKIEGSSVSFKVAGPDQLTVEVNGDWNNSLHVFVNGFEKDAPNLKDPNLIYFGPGMHVIAPMSVGSGKTVYIAGGAVVYGKLPEGVPNGGAVFLLKGNDITLRGRGIIDGSLMPWHHGELVSPVGENLRMEGVVLRDPPGFAVPIRESNHVTVENVKLLGWRLNGDGIDIINSRDVTVSDSFVRVFDDLVVVKASTQGGQESRDITVKHMVLWNEIAHSLSLGAELRVNAENILFTDCDVIHDKGREWSLRVFNTDSGTVKHVVFEKIRMEEDRRPFSLWIGKDMWSRDAERGHIEDVEFRDIEAARPEQLDHAIQLVGFDAGHGVRGVSFERVMLGGKPMKMSEIEQNAFVSDVSVKP